MGWGCPSLRVDIVMAILPDLKISWSILADIQIRASETRGRLSRHLLECGRDPARVID